MSLYNFSIFIYITSMTKEEKLIKLESLRKQSIELKKEIDYYNALQTGLKLVLNGSYRLPHY